MERRKVIEAISAARSEIVMVVSILWINTDEPQSCSCGLWYGCN